MILAVLSTHPQPFPRAVRLASEMARLCAEELHVQLGHTSLPAGVEARTRRWYATRADLGNAMQDASVVIVHGGSGCIFHALRVGVRPIAVPRLARHGEHVDDHQLQLCSKLAAANIIITWNDGESAAEVLERLRMLPETRLPERPDLRPAVWAAARELAR